MPGPELYVARVEPYRLSDLGAWLASISKSPLVEVTPIGKTVEGRGLEIVRVGRPDAPYRVFLRARAHAWEPGGNWVVQVMALKSREGADKLVSDLKNKGYPAFVVNPASGLYRVRVGPFAKRTEAEQIAGRLAKEGYQSPAVQAR